MYRFEKLTVYHDAMNLLEEVYKITKLLPEDEKSNLSDQLRKSSSSVVLYITEGIETLGETDFRSYLKHALRSLCDTVIRLKMVFRLYGIDVEPAMQMCDEVEEKLQAIAKTLTEERKYRRLQIKHLAEESANE